MRFTEQMLDLFAEYGVRATCFVLGEVAEAFPELVRRIAAGGHEIGVHGWHHHRLFQLEPSEFRESLARAKTLMEELSGRPVCGYRAVAMSISRETLWAYDVVAELGFTYSSSIYPFRGPCYGVPDAPVGTHRVPTACGAFLLEIPLSVIRFGPVRVPALGGGYLRHLPVGYSLLALRALEWEGRPAVVYLHPYELDTDAGPDLLPAQLTNDERRRLARFVHGQYRNRHLTESKVRKILGSASFAPLEEVFRSELNIVQTA